MVRWWELEGEATKGWNERLEVKTRLADEDELFLKTRKQTEGVLDT